MRTEAGGTVYQVAKKDDAETRKSSKFAVSFHCMVRYCQRYEHTLHTEIIKDISFKNYLSAL